MMKKEKEPSNWAELSWELTVSIFLRLSVFDILVNAQKVCKSWNRVSKDPSIWKKIDIGICKKAYKLDGMCRHAIDRSQGGLVEINLGKCCSDSLLDYIADRSSNLRSLEFKMFYRVTNEGLENAVAKLPSLEELNVSYPISRLNLKAIGLSSPKLKTLKLVFSYFKNTSITPEDRDAIEIAESMPELRHLQLLENGLTNTGLNAILDHCSHLEYLDLRQCLNIKLVGDLEKRCSERIKVLRRPDDSTDDSPFYVDDIDSEDDLGLVCDDNEDNYDDSDIEIDYEQLAEKVVAVVFYS
ncbi:hypothetical protein AALP_AA5G038300 [Arabis alpina]|uniref:F-box domain-containing protein n=1 Tax=Arabis alpina TaxID=50452 RepID=A0A087GUS7_ARAAL|nr:hypothetical protein AALP_AA5G038300 [Arabis alpina]